MHFNDHWELATEALRLARVLFQHWHFPSLSGKVETPSLQVMCHEDFGKALSYMASMKTIDFILDVPDPAGFYDRPQFLRWMEILRQKREVRIQLRGRRLFSAALNHFTDNMAENLRDPGFQGTMTKFQTSIRENRKLAFTDLRRTLPARAADDLIGNALSLQPDPDKLRRLIEAFEAATVTEFATMPNVRLISGGDPICGVGFSTPEESGKVHVIAPPKAGGDAERDLGRMVSSLNLLSKRR